MMIYVLSEQKEKEDDLLEKKMRDPLGLCPKLWNKYVIKSTTFCCFKT